MATSGLYGNSSESIGLYGNTNVFGGTYFQWFIFQQNNDQPVTPTGGTWDFTTNTGTPPTGWTTVVASVAVNPVWFSTGFVDSRNPTVIVWSVPSLLTSSNSIYATAYSQTFTGNGTQTAFTLSSSPVTVNNTDVSINGVVQVPGVDYTLNSVTLTTTTPVINGAVMLVKYKQSLPNSYYGLASNVQFTPVGALTSTNVQSAIAEVVTDLALSSGSSTVGYLPAGTNAVATTVQAKLRQTVSVKDFGAVGDGTTNDSAAFLAALTAADCVVVPIGNYLISTQITIPAANKTLVGLGGTIVRSYSLTSSAVFTATSKDNLTFDSLKFSVSTSTPHTISGSFINIDTCHFAIIKNCTFDGAIPGTSVNRESLFSAVYTPSCNDLIIQGNQFKYIYGNSCGANDGAGTGVNGKNVTIANNVFFNTVDTGVGCYTNCQNVTITGNLFDRTDYTTSYNGVMIDVAGASNVTITANTFRGNVTGIRILQNLVYTNTNILVEGNVFSAQVSGTGGEPANGVKIFHGDGTTTSQNSNVTIKNNQFIVTTSGNGVYLASVITDTTKAITVQIDGNTFDLTSGTCNGVAIGKLTSTGNIKMLPGNNAFNSGAATGTTAVNGTLPDTKSAIGQQNLVAYTTNLALTTSVANPGYFYLERGLYAIFYSFGTNTASSGTAVFEIKSKAGTSLPSNISATVAASNTFNSNVWNVVDTAGVYKYEYTPAAGTLTTNFNYANLVRLL